MTKDVAVCPDCRQPIRGIRFYGTEEVHATLLDVRLRTVGPRCDACYRIWRQGETAICGRGELPLTIEA